MISYSIYKIVHLAGILMVFTALGGILLNGKRPHPSKKLIAATHGAGLFLVLLGGFGALARLGIGSLPGWIIAKLALWIFLGAALWFATTKPRFALPLWWSIIVSGILAAMFAVTKPF